jgi:translocation and assembly module TamB
LKGSLKSLLISRLKMKGLQGSSVDISGKLAGLDNFDNLKADLKVNELATNSALIKLIVGDEALLSNYNILDKISLKGNLNGDAKLLNLEAKIVSTLGDISFEGRLKDVADQNLIQYEGTLHTVDLAVYKFFKEDLGVGVLSTDIFLKSDATFQDLTAKGQIHKLQYSDYLYQDLDIDGTLLDSVLNLKAASLYPNA